MLLSAVAPELYEDLLREKVARVTELFASLAPPRPTVYASAPTGYRMRVEFRVWHAGERLDYVMFDPCQPKIPLPVHNFVIASPQIQLLMPRLRDYLQQSPELRRKLFQVEFLSAGSGEVVVTLVYHRPLDDGWQRAATSLVQLLDPVGEQISVIGRSRKQKIVIGRDFVVEKLTVHERSYRYLQYEQSFSQPNAGINRQMLEWACLKTHKGDLLELYCGNGNFTLPLAAHFGNIIATEQSKTAIRAARANLELNSIDNVQLVRMAADEISQAMRGTRSFRRLAALPRPLDSFDLRTLFVDPPRAGLDETTREIAKGFDAVMYISCNPYTLLDNLIALQPYHEVTAFALFDQFPYTEHMECGVTLRRRSQ